MKTIVLSGGHLSPAVAVAEEFKSRGYRVVVFGRPYAFTEAREKSSLEKEMFEEMGVDFRPVDISRVPSALSIPSYSLSLMGSTNSIGKTLKELRPSAVLSFGSYVGIPLLAAAALQKIPIFLHEQTTIVGRNNKFFEKFAQKVFISWHETAQSFQPKAQHKMILTGNPIRKEVLSLANKQWKNKKEFTIYITGGSTGAHAINEVIANSLEKLLKKFRVIHQAGDSHYNDLDMLEEKRKKLPKELQKKYKLVRYVNLSEIKKIYEQADIIVGRSGANTVTEVALLGKPSVFIPLPLAQYNEQELLAQKLNDQGVALIIKQSELTAENLLGALENVTRHYETYVKHGNHYRKSEEITRHKTACEYIVNIIESWSHRDGDSTS